MRVYDSVHREPEKKEAPYSLVSIFTNINTF